MRRDQHKNDNVRQRWTWIRDVEEVGREEEKEEEAGGVGREGVV